jgi:tetratricopeptide (TPR) repeat protein
VTARLLCTVLLVSLVACRKAPSPAPLAAEPPAAKVAAAGNRPPGAAPSGQLSRVRPPAEPCVSRKGARPGELVARAAELHTEREHARALACAEEALRAVPRSVPALHWRATSLVALGRLEEARLAFARALAVDPDDPETLLGAADLYVTRAPGEREALLVGLEYALRGARVAGGRKEKDVAAQLLGVAAMAENDLGRSRDALLHADRALEHRPRDASLWYERGVALYELVRFDEARGALEKALALAPEDPWALHYLALVAEHAGEKERAEKLEAKARARSPRDFRGVDLTRAEFETEVTRAIAVLPDDERRALATVSLEISAVPALDDLTAVDPPLSPTILGLFRGPSEHEACDDLDPDEPCRSIVLYWRNLARYARDRRELSEQVRVTLLHELGHLHGETDDELRDRGLE